MDAQTFANELNGCEYSSEGSKELWQRMKDAGYVAVFGASDDLMEFRGAINDEVDCYGGGEVYLDATGFYEEKCDNYDCPHEAALKEKSKTIEVLWCAEPDISWTYKTEIPHATFNVLEDGETYCRGIVFALADAGD